MHTKRTGLLGVLKKVTGKIKSQLSVSFKPLKNLDADTKLHSMFLPSTCLVQKKLVMFISGYRNYAGQSLMKESMLGSYKKPGGSIVFSSFPKLVDNIDILEVLCKVWVEDYLTPLSATQKKSFPTIITKVKEIIHKIYPVLYANEF